MSVRLEVIRPWLRLERVPHGVPCDIHDCEQYGIPARLDGKTFTSTLPAPTEKEIRKWWGKKVNPADFVTGSATIQPGQSASVIGWMVGGGATSNTTKWLNNTPVAVAPLRYSIKVGSKNFVFPWLAPIQRDFASVPQWDY